MRRSEQLLRRRGGTPRDSYKSSQPSSLVTAFKSMDMFDKIDTPNERESRIKTESGGCFSIIGIFIILWLVLSETYYYIFPTRSEHLIIDNMYDKQLEIIFDITFHNIPCSSLGICIMDVTGEQQVHAEMLNHEIHKTRLSLDGEALHDEPIKEIPGIINELFQYMRMDRAAEGCRVEGSFIFIFHISLFVKS